jgi:hypothetical protein
MNPPPEPFDRLQKLLALKRYEQPPPGYFREFSSKVIARIEIEGLLGRISWWQRLLGALTVRPFAAAGYGAAVLGLFAVGASASRYLEPDENASMAVTSPWASSALMAEGESAAPANPVLLDPVDATSSVKPVLASSPAHALFDVNRLNVQRVSYSPR